MEFVLTKEYAELFLYQFVKKPGGGYEILDENTVDKYLGKKIFLRSPMFCKSDKICHKCMGELARWLGISTVGLTTGRVSNSMLAKKMKLFHNAKMAFDLVNIDDLLD